MNSRSFKWCGAVTLLLLISTFAAPVQAVSPSDAGELSQLRQAYGTLARADHDYKGHRVKAMHAIEAACDILCANIRGNGKAKQQQAVSDSELRQAQTLVEQARATASQQNQQKVAEHLTNAINEISVALTIK